MRPEPITAGAFVCQEAGMDDTTRERLDRIDQRIAHDRTLYLRATWAGHEGEAETYEIEVDRLLDLRAVVERGGLTAGLPLDLETQ
jgi:hypothetical protein